MTKQPWVPPVEFDPDSTPPPQHQERSRTVSPGILAEEGQPHFDGYIRASQCSTEAADRDTTDLSAAASRPFGGARSWLLGSLAAIIVGILFLEAYSYLEELFQRSWILGGLFSTLFLLLLVSLSLVLHQQVADVRRLRSVAQLRSAAERVRAANGYGAAIALAERAAALYQRRPDVEAGVVSYRAAVTDAHSDREVLALFSQSVLHPLDQRAVGIVTNHASQTALLTALSPLAVLDAAFSLWRNVRMVREIAMVYEGRPGSLGTFRLVRDVLLNMAAAGATEWLSDAGADLFGSNVAASLSVKIGQGMAMGILSVRVGLIAMRLCRPIPFDDGEQPRFTHLRDQVLTSLSRILSADRAGQ